MGVAEGISRARYYPDFKKIRVKLLAEPGTLKLIGAQLVGGEGIKERCDFLAMAARKGLTLHDIAWMENVYSPAIGALNEPMALAAQNGLVDGRSGRDRVLPVGTDQLREVPAGEPCRPTWPGVPRAPPTVGRRDPQVLFWKHLFVPLYRRLPWKVKHVVILAMPGSHRARWSS
jgi:hypothetical protein